MNSKNTISYNVSISVIVTLLFYLTTNKVYDTPFSFGDDHRIIGMLHPDKASNSYKESLYNITPDLKGCFEIDLQIGRFRPLGWSYNKILCTICGDNFYLYRLSNLIILFLSAFSLLNIFSCFKIDKLSALTVLFIYVFGKNNETWWTLIPPAQNVGELFLLSGIYFWLLYRKINKNSFYVIPAILFFLSGICKESFIFCIPILLLTDYFFFNPTKQLFIKEYLFSLVAFIIPFSCLLATVLYINKIYSYSYPNSIVDILIYNSYQFIYSAIFFFAPIYLFVIAKKKIDNLKVFKLIFVFLLWGGIQLILLKGIKLDGQHHYLIPWLIYPLILTAISLSKIRHRFIKYYIMLFLCYSIMILLFVKNTYINSCSYAAYIQSYHKMLNTIKNDSSKSDIIYLCDNATIGDWIGGTKIIMDNKGINKELYFCTTESKIPSWQLNYALHSPQHSFKHINLNNAFKPNGNWIILVENPSKNGLINDNIIFYQKNDSSFIKIKSKELFVNGCYNYFCSTSPKCSVFDILKGDFKLKNQEGFYAIKLYDLEH